jgi:NADPH-dependent glutamate synthase beta subunit-like oxidoreductase
MPAIDEEVDGAEEEGVKIHYLAAPAEIYRKNGVATGMKCQRMELGEPDSSGRRRPVPIEGDTFDLDFSCLIAAVSQAPEVAGLDPIVEGNGWINVDEKFATKVEGVYSGGDNTNLGLVIHAIAHGRTAARAIHEMISGNQAETTDSEKAVVKAEKIRLDFYPEKQRIAPREMAVDERLKDMHAEIVSTYADEDAIAEASRCMSCGMCFDCGTCWSFKKCSEVCPCGYIEMH